MKLLNGAELAGYIKERQAAQVRALLQAHHVIPRLVIIQTKDDPVISTYVRLKQAYAKDILGEVKIELVSQESAVKTIQKYNDDQLVHGIIVQLPLEDTSQTDQIVSVLAPSKDVDGMGGNSLFTPATAMAIDWLLNGYNVSLQNKKIVILGMGRLVGAPLYRLWQKAGYNVDALDINTPDIVPELKQADIIVTATGVPGLLKSSMVPIGAVVVDAGTASESGKIVGDVASELYDRHDVSITPRVGGVGPLTISALFDNVIRASQPK